MEVFLFFSQTDELALVEATMQAWEPIQWADPFNVVQCKQHQFEIQRRVIADNMATGDHYILTDLGCVPDHERAIPEIMKLLSANDGLMGLEPNHGSILLLSGVPHGVRICQKGTVTKWPSQYSSTYDLEHADAVRVAGKHVSVCPTFFRRLQEC